MTSYAIAAHNSLTAFRYQVWPVLKPMLNADNLWPLETSHNLSPNSLEQRLDTDAGLDAIYRSEGQLYGLASRIQGFVYKPYNTFTVRLDTELKKRIAAFDSGALFPRYTVQAYHDVNGVLVSLGVVETEPLITLVEREYYRPKPWSLIGIQTNPQDGKKFAYVRWDRLETEGKERYPDLDFGLKTWSGAATATAPIVPAQKV